MTASLTSFEVAGIAFGLREAVIALIALVALYMAIVLWRMRRLRGQKAAKAGGAGEPVAPSLGSEQDFEEDEGAAVRLSDAARRQAAAAWEEAPAGMADDLLRSGLEQEIAILRDEVDALRGELAALRNDMQQEMAHLRATQSVSPIYGDAMQLAQAGYDPAAIAERCGIARAEAELVVALTKSQER